MTWQLLLLLGCIKGAAMVKLENVTISPTTQFLPNLTSHYNNITNTTSKSTEQQEIWNLTTPISPVDAFTESFDVDEIADLTCIRLCQNYSAPKTTQESPRKPEDKIPLYITATYEGPNAGWDASGCVPAIEMAFDDINARTDILKQYELRPIWNDTKVS